MRRRVSKILLKCANIIFLVLFSYIFLRVIWHTQDIIGGEKSRYVISWLIWGILGIVCVAFCRISIPKNYRIGLIIILLLIQYIYVWAIYSQVDSDAYVITYIGYNLAKGNLIALEGFWKQYLAVYTNNIPATAIITAIFRIWFPDSLEQSWYMLSVIAAILSDITLVFIYKLVKMTLGRKYALVAMMLSIALITMSEPGTILYTDIMALWTTPAALYSLMLCRKKQIHYIVLASLILAIGAWIKPQSWVITIAIGIMLLLEWLHAIEENQRRLLRKRMALFIGAFGVISLGLSMITYSAINLMGKEYKVKMESLIAAGKISSESRVMFVNDGSSDNTWPIICELHESDPLFSGINLSRNRGHQNAVLAGLMEAKDKCDITISIDCDGQDDINAMDAMVDAYVNDGCEVVYGVRSKRDTDTFFKRFTAESFYKLLNAMGAEVVYNHADYRLMSARVLHEFANFKEVNLFLRGMVPLVGFKSTSVAYERHERIAGESHYPLSKMLSLAFDGITSLSVKPIRFITGFGVIVALISFIGVIWAIVEALLGATVSGWASMTSIICFVSGVQLICLGVIGEYIGKIYMETKRRPRYIISDRTWDEDEK